LTVFDSVLSPSTHPPTPLPQADKLDPREQAKMETREWINDVVDRLTVRIEQFEYEMEDMQANLKKKAKPPPKLVQVRPCFGLLDHHVV
jgi:CCR4-NOT transcription complex subunit 3